MGRREDLLRREAAGWAAIDAAIGPLGDEEVERPGMNADGWSVKDLLWHLATWQGEAAVAIRAGAPDELGAAEVDEINSRALERGRAASLHEVRRAAAGRRREMLEAFGERPETDTSAAGWLEESGPTHYDEHHAELDRWCRRLRPGA